MRNIETRSGVSGVWRSDEVRGGSVCASRSGVALIIVLGLMVLMMVLCVTFAIYMRTERVAAANYAKDVVVRQLAYAAISRALAAIDADMGSRAYPEWDVLVSGGADPVNSVTNAPASEWIPQAVWPSANNPLLVRVNGGTTTLATAFAPQWFNVTSVGGSGGTDYRVGYAVFNCSGMLDANYAGGGTSRWIGSSASELQIVNLGEIGTAANAGSLALNRPYETGQELDVVGRPGGLNFVRGAPSNFVAYSASPTGSAVFVGGSAAELVSNSGAIIDGFTNSGCTMAQAGALFTNLVDYADADFLPGNLGGAATSNPEGSSVEPVWMINEVLMSNAVWATPFGTNSYMLTGTNYVKIEVTYPFLPRPPSALPPGMRLNLEVRFTSSSIPELMLPAPVVFANITIAGPSVEFAVPANPALNRGTPLLGGPITAPFPSTWDLAAEVRGWVTMSGDVVDSVSNNPVVFTRSYSINLPTSPLTNTFFYRDADCEFADPRLNGQSSYRSLTYYPATNTLGTTNNYTVGTWWRTTGPGLRARWQYRDRDSGMYVRNGPLQVAGELSYLFTGDPWETVRIYNRPSTPPPPTSYMMTVLDNFSVRTNTTTYRKGLVNPNTAQEAVLRSLLADLPLDAPHGTGASLITGTEVDQTVQALTSMTATNPMSKISDMGKIDVGGILSGQSEVNKESLIRNMADLCSVRQNYFLILAFVETSRYVVQIGTTRLGRQRVLAEVWRDPIAAPDGHHPTLIRMVRILNEE